MSLFHLYSTVFCVSYALTIASPLNFDKATKEELVVVRKVDVLLNDLLRNVLDYIRGKKDSSLDWAYDAQNVTNFHEDVSFTDDVNGIRPMPPDENGSNNVDKVTTPLHPSHYGGPILPPIVLPIDDGTNAIPQSFNSKSGHTNVAIMFPSNQPKSTLHDQGINGNPQMPLVDGDRFLKWLRSSAVGRKLYNKAEEAKMARERAASQ